MTAPVQILLAVYDGAAFLPVQLASYTGQSHADWSLLVSDDGSSDDSRSVVARFGDAHPGRVRMIDGPGRGYGQNFLHLLRQADGDAAHVALSDQDDAWLPHHLARAVSRLAAHPPERPVLYCARSIICDARMRPLRPTRPFRQEPRFAHALVQSIAGGHTMVLNRAALALAQGASRQVEGPICHDWFLYQLITGAGGVVIHDAEPALNYRQHGGNEVGEAVGPRDLAGRIAKLMEGRFGRWNAVNTATLQRLRPLLTPDAARRLDRFVAARNARTGLGRAIGLVRAGVRRRSAGEQAAMYLAAILGRI